MSETFRFDLRTKEIQNRHVREGNSRISQYRIITHNPDGSREYGEWETSSIITNYGDIYDKKPSLLERIKNWVNR